MQVKYTFKKSCALKSIMMMINILKDFSIFMLAMQKVLAAPPLDEIKNLPGWDSELPSKQYSGYLNITDTKHYHYWFVECEVEPENAPVVLWLNGGPGCSSLDGLVYEHGPFRIDDSTLPPTLYRFEYTWSKLANMIYLESPVGVGFSYSDNDNDYHCTDDTTALDNFLSVEKFFELFPEYKNNPFYITGESYGGIYVPTLAETILQATLNETYTGAPLKGIAVGNGCTGDEVGICGSHITTFVAQFFVQNTAFLSQNLKNKLDENCNWNTPYDISVGCAQAMIEMSKELYMIDAYDVYGECIDGEQGEMLGRQYSKAGMRALNDGEHGPTFCINTKEASAYLNQDDVIEAIHVKKQDFRWKVCGTDERWTYQRTRPNLPRDTYPFLNEYIRVLIYNGDWDACVPYTDNEMWTRGMGYEVKEDWHSWYYKGQDAIKNQVGGYATTYATPHNFTFITIRGGRHEVPETAPVPAFEMLNRLLKNIQF